MECNKKHHRLLLYCFD